MLINTGRILNNFQQSSFFKEITIMYNRHRHRHRHGHGYGHEHIIQNTLWLLKKQ